MRAEIAAQMLATCRSLAHCSGLVPVYGVDPDLDHCVGLVHPYYERGSVKDYLDSLGGAGIPALEALDFALQIMKALAAVLRQHNKSLYLATHLAFIREGDFLDWAGACGKGRVRCCDFG